MQYAIAFLEGIITFISPCLLPMLPIYVSYFAGGGERSTGKTLKIAAGFVLGFTVVFTALGALAGTAGGFLREHRTAVNLISGLVVIVFGASMNTRELGFFSAVLFGMIFSLGWTPCVGAFLGSALMLASQQGSTLTGTLMLLAYSLGLGVPFLLSAVLIDRLKAAFDWIKRNYERINAVCGVFLVAVGVLMATGLLERLLGLLS